MFCEKIKVFKRSTNTLGHLQEDEEEKGLTTGICSILAHWAFPASTARAWTPLTLLSMKQDRLKSSGFACTRVISPVLQDRLKSSRFACTRVISSGFACTSACHDVWNRQLRQYLLCWFMRAFWSVKKIMVRSAVIIAVTHHQLFEWCRAHKRWHMQSMQFSGCYDQMSGQPDGRFTCSLVQSATKYVYSLLWPT